MAVVGDGGVGEGGEVGERGVHLGGGALEEASASGDEERVSREHAAGVGCIRGCHVVTDRILGVAGRGEASGG